LSEPGCRCSFLLHRLAILHNQHATIGARFVLMGKPAAMLPLLKRVSRASGRFAIWFDSRFGWFFTNGMKHRQERTEQPLKA
jgi:hypothetical protein